MLLAQNKKLVGIFREMCAKIEAEEREYGEALEKEQGKAAKRMKLLPHCKNNSKHSVIPTVLKYRRSLRSATYSKRSLRGLGVIMSSHDHSSLNYVYHPRLRSAV